MQQRVQLCSPCPTGHPAQTPMGTLRVGAEPSVRRRIYTQVAEAEQPHVHPPSLSSRSGWSRPCCVGRTDLPLGRPPPAELGMWHGAGKQLFNSVTDVGTCECPSKAQLRLFLPVADAEGMPACWKGSPHLHPQAQGQPNVLGFPQQHRTASTFVPRGRYSNS